MIGPLIQAVSDRHFFLSVYESREIGNTINNVSG
jgi:hypothetical protein